MNPEEIFPIVKKINSEISDLIYDLSLMMGDDNILTDFQPFISMKTDGESTGLSILGEYLWDSENDSRSYIDLESDEYVPLEPFLRKEIYEKIHILTRIFEKFSTEEEK